MITVSTITDSQILELQKQIESEYIAGVSSPDMLDTTAVALGLDIGAFPSDYYYRRISRARARCAEILSERSRSGAP